MTVLLDELSPIAVREVLGRLMASSDSADIAVASVRLHAIDLSHDETRRIQRCRILLGKLDSTELLSLNRSPDARRARLSRLRQFLTSGQVEVRSAGMGAWTPDFSVFGGVAVRGAAHGSVCIVGAHYFHEPPVAGGPSLTCIITGPAAARRLRLRFDDLWAKGHDVGQVVISAIDAASSRPGQASAG